MKATDDATVDSYRSERFEGEMQRSLRSDPEANRLGLELLRRLHGGHSGERLVASLEGSAGFCDDDH